MGEVNKGLSKMQAFEVKIGVCEEITTSLDEEKHRLNQEVLSLKNQVDFMEQRSRNINLLVHSVKENINENTTDVSVEILQRNGLPIGQNGIARSRRYGNVVPRSPGP